MSARIDYENDKPTVSENEGQPQGSSIASGVPGGTATLGKVGGFL